MKEENEIIFHLVLDQLYFYFLKSLKQDKNGYLVNSELCNHRRIPILLKLLYEDFTASDLNNPENSILKISSDEVLEIDENVFPTDF